MKILPLSEAKMKFSALVDHIRASGEEVIITRNGRPAVIMLDYEDYEGWKETCEVKSNPEFLAEIRQSIADVESGRAKMVPIDNLDDLFGK